MARKIPEPYRPQTFAEKIGYYVLGPAVLVAVAAGIAWFLAAVWFGPS